MASTIVPDMQMNFDTPSQQWLQQPCNLMEGINARIASCQDRLLSVLILEGPSSIKKRSISAEASGPAESV